MFSCNSMCIIFQFFQHKLLVKKITRRIFKKTGHAANCTRSVLMSVFLYRDKNRINFMPTFYFNIHVSLSLWYLSVLMASLCPVPLFTVVPQNFTNKDCFVCLKSEKNAFLVILGSMRKGMSSVQYKQRRSFSVSSPPRRQFQVVGCVH